MVGVGGSGEVRAGSVGPWDSLGAVDMLGTRGLALGFGLEGGMGRGFASLLTGGVGDTEGSADVVEVSRAGREGELLPVDLLGFFWGMGLDVATSPLSSAPAVVGAGGSVGVVLPRTEAPTFRGG